MRSEWKRMKQDYDFTRPVGRSSRRGSLDSIDQVSPVRRERVVRIWKYVVCEVDSADFVHMNGSVYHASRYSESGCVQDHGLLGSRGRAANRILTRAKISRTLNQFLVNGYPGLT